MPSTFLLPDDRLDTLTATRQGQISLGGFNNYQAGYAIARVATLSPVDWGSVFSGPTHRIQYRDGERNNQLMKPKQFVLNSVTHHATKRMDSPENIEVRQLTYAINYRILSRDA